MVDAVELILTSNPMGPAEVSHTTKIGMSNTKMSLAGQLDWTEVIANGHRPKIITLDGVTYEPVSWGTKLGISGNVLQIIYQATPVVDMTPSFGELTFAYSQYTQIDNRQFFTIAFIIGSNNPDLRGIMDIDGPLKKAYQDQMKEENLHGDIASRLKTKMYDSRGMPGIHSALRRTEKTLEGRQYKAHTALKEKGLLNVPGRFVIIVDGEIENIIS